MPRARRVLTLAVSLLLAACQEESPTCSPGAERCADGCAALATDARNCGACGAACAAGEVCSDGACAATCTPPLSTCGAAAVRACADLRTDPRNCGACGKTCGTTELCLAGACVDACLLAGTTRCGDACVDLASSSANCGACARTCAGTEVCRAGACVDTCSLAGTTRCGDACVDLASSSANCGACARTCAGAEVCRAGACADTCSLAGTTRCGDACVDLASSSANCGTCARTCADAEVCRAGACVDTCSLAGTTRCGDACVDVASDDANCGACANACAATATCRAGACVDTCAVAGAARCGAACVDLRTDAANCGACGQACPGWGVCADGGCAAPVCRGGVTFPDATALVPGMLWANGVLAVDLDGDDLDDLVAFSRWGAAPEQRALTVALAVPGGGFAAADAYTIAAPGSVLATDLDEDGHLDLIVAASPTPTRLLNDGTGHFTVHPGGVALRLRLDLDGDGRLDEVVERSPTLDVHLSTTTSVQQLGIGYSTGATDVRAADLTGDGRPDLVVAPYGQQSFEVALASADGTFASLTYEDPALFRNTIVAMELSDVDGDRDLDLVLLAHLGIMVARNDGAGGLGPLQEWPLPTSGWFYWDLHLADLDEDGRVDLLVGSDLGVRVARGAGDGTFGEPRLVRAGTSRQLAMTDVDRDGRPDLVSASNGGVEVLFSRGGSFREPATRTFTASASTLAAADLDGDGRDDLAALAYSTIGDATTLAVLRAGRSAPETYPAPGGSYLAVADVDGDRVPDAVVATWSTAGALLLRGHGDGTFEPAAALSAIRGSTVLVADITGDRVPDLVARDEVGSRHLLRVALGHGDGTFEPAGVPTELSLGAAHVLAAGDVDGDGRADLVLARDGTLGTTDDTIVAVLRSLGDGSFAAPVEHAVGGLGLGDMVVADLDRDGASDVVLAVEESWSGTKPARLAILFSDAGGLRPPTWYPLPHGGFSSLAAVRATGGRRPDLAAILDVEEAIVLIAPEGARAFAPPRFVGYHRVGSRILGADLDGDLRDDLAVADDTGLVVFRTACAP